MKKQLKKNHRNEGKTTSHPPDHRSNFLTPTEIGPWIVGTNKMSRGATASAISRIISARLGGWRDPEPYENAAMRRAKALLPEALSSLEVFAGCECEPGHILFNEEFPYGAVYPHGWDARRGIGATVHVPMGAHHCRNACTELDTAVLWDCVASLAMVDAANQWLAVSYSPPFLPLFWRIERAPYAGAIAKIQSGLREFCAELGQAEANQRSRRNNEKVWNTPQPLELS